MFDKYGSDMKWSETSAQNSIVSEFFEITLFLLNRKKVCVIFAWIDSREWLVDKVQNTEGWIECKERAKFLFFPFFLSSQLLRWVLIMNQWKMYHLFPLKALTESSAVWTVVQELIRAFKEKIVIFWWINKLSIPGETRSNRFTHHQKIFTEFSHFFLLAGLLNGSLSILSVEFHDHKNGRYSYTLDSQCFHRNQVKYPNLGQNWIRLFE